MSHKATNWAFQQKGLLPSQKLLLLHLADRHNPDFGCFPSIKKLTIDCEISRGSVIKHLSNLEEKGLIKKEERKRDNGSQTSNNYILGFELEGVQYLDPPPLEVRPPQSKKPYSHNMVTKPVSDISIGKPKKSSQIPINWIPSDKNISDATSLNLSFTQWNTEAEQFRDYHISKGSSFKCWDAAWRTWLRNSKKFSKNKPSNIMNLMSMAAREK